MFHELQDKEYVRYSNVSLETIDGKKIDVEFVSNVYFLDGEKYIQCNIRDIANQIKIEKTLTGRIDEKDELLSEIQHRIKNSFSMITSLISLKRDKVESIEVKETLDELTYRVLSVSELYIQLYEMNSFDYVDIELYCNKIIKSIVSLTRNLQINTNIEPIILTSKNASTIGMILIELISNSIKYAFNDSNKGIIDVKLKKNNSQIIMEVRDNGVGFQKDFNLNRIESTGLCFVSTKLSLFMQRFLNFYPV
jgi:two-component sensor histidine kinase